MSRIFYEGTFGTSMSAVRMIKSIEPKKITNRAVCFSGQTPPLHAEIKKKFLAAQAMLKAAIKNAVRKLQSLLMMKNKIQILQNTVCNNPGLPKRLDWLE